MFQMNVSKRQEGNEEGEERREERRGEQGGGRKTEESKEAEEERGRKRGRKRVCKKKKEKKRKREKKGEKENENSWFPACFGASTERSLLLKLSAKSQVGEKQPFLPAISRRSRDKKEVMMRFLLLCFQRFQK
jgi:hypothetical protein